MKNKFSIIASSLLLLSSCSNFDLYTEIPAQTNNNTDAIQAQASSILGNIDPNQDWNSTTSNTITITANANLSNIAKVQILTESPFLNTDAKVLNEATATNGETVTLVYDAPNIKTRLIAACVSEDGTYYTKGFNVGDNEVTFQSQSSNRRARRASESYYNFPSADNFVLPANLSFCSYGAMRSIRSAQGESTSSDISMWKGKGWEKERLWRNNSSSNSKNSLYKKTYSGSDWYMQNYSIRRDIENGLTESEKANLQDIFNNYLYWSKNTYADQHSKNLPLIRESTMFKLYDNQLETTGEPVVFSPVQATSEDMAYSDLYYYYYNPADVSDLTEDELVQYIKDLPKFMAMSCADAAKGYIATDQFFKNNEYVLPYYGDAVDATTLSNYSTDGVIYRIRNGYQQNGADYYMTNKGDKANMETMTDDSSNQLTLQLWQLFVSNDGKSCYLYNVGAQCFMYYSGNYNTAFSYTDYIESTIPAFQLSVDNGAYHFTRDGSKGLGTDLGTNTGIWSDKTTATGERFDWYLEPYKGSWNITAKTTLQQVSDKAFVAQSFAIPAGYKLGFVLRKMKTSNVDGYNRYYGKSYDGIKNGETFADGRLNREINQYPGHFGSAMTKYGMLEDDPRVSIFSANEKTYLTFEDGSDCNFVDLIIEVSDGVTIVNETPLVDSEAYLLCFEDRPNIADYDLNDVVLRCVRKNKTTLTMTLLACGANDDVVIHGATGWEYNNWEIHEAFGATEADAKGNRFINTEKGGTQITPLSSDVTVDENTTVAEYLQGIYLENQTTKNVIKVATKGEPPFGIMIPYDMNYQLEKVSVTKAYLKFINWSQDMNTDQDWYLYEENDKVYPNPFKTQE